MNTINKYFLKADQLATGPSVKINGQDKHSTYPGSIISIILFGILIWYAVLKIIEVARTDKPTIIREEELTGNYRTFSLVDAKFLPAFRLYTTEALPGKETSIDLGIYSTYVSMKAVRVVFSNDPASSAPSFVEYPIKNCKDLENKKPYESHYSSAEFKEKMDSDFKCLEVPANDPVEVGGKPLTPGSSHFKLMVFPALGGEPTGASPDIRDLKISFVIQSYFGRYKEYNEPVFSELAQIKAMDLSPSFTKTVRSIFSANLLEDTTPFDLLKKRDNKVFMTRESEQHSAEILLSRKLACNAANYADTEKFARLCPAYGIIEYVPDDFTVTVKRTYPDFLAAFSEVGGFKGTLFMVVGLAYGFYCEWRMNQVLRAGVIPEDQMTYLKEKGQAKAIHLAKPEDNKLTEKEREKQEKKLSEEIEEKLTKAADFMVDRNSNMDKIVKDLALLQHMKHFMLKKRQLSLLPLITVERLQKELQEDEDKKKAIEEAKKENRQPRTPSQSLLTNPDAEAGEKKSISQGSSQKQIEPEKPQSIPEAIEEIKTHFLYNALFCTPSPSEELSHKIDMYILKHLGLLKVSDTGQIVVIEQDRKGKPFDRVIKHPWVTKTIALSGFISEDMFEGKTVPTQGLEEGQPMSAMRVNPDAQRGRPQAQNPGGRIHAQPITPESFGGRNLRSTANPNRY